MIELVNVSKMYGRRKALQNVSLSFSKGRMIGISGENGSGKTTLLKVLAGLLTPNEGSLNFHGEPITRRCAHRIAYMPDVDLFYPYFTVEQLFHFYASQFDDFDLLKAKEIAHFLKVPADRQIKHLSKGKRARVKIAATLGREATCFLLDEPFSGLDPMVREEIIKGLIQFTDIEKQTIILSTHEIKEVEPLLDEIVVLKEGRILAHEEIDGIRSLYGMDTTTWMRSLFK